MLKKALIGYYAKVGGNGACHGDCLVVMSSKQSIRNYLPNECLPLVLKVTLKDMIKGLKLGAAYDLDSLSLEEFKKHVNMVDYQIKKEFEGGVTFFTVRK